MPNRNFFKNRILTKPADVQYGEPEAAPKKIDWLAVIRLADQESDAYAAGVYGLGEVTVGLKRAEMTLSGEYRPSRDLRDVSTADQTPEYTGRPFFDHICQYKETCGALFRSVSDSPDRCPRCLMRQR